MANILCCKLLGHPDEEFKLDLYLLIFGFYSVFVGGHQKCHSIDEFKFAQPEVKNNFWIRDIF